MLFRSPDDLSVAFAREKGRAATILDLQSGDPQLTVDTDIKVRALGVTGSTIVVFGKGEVRTWSLTAGDNRAKFISGIVRTATLDRSPSSRLQHPTAFTSVSPDLSRIVTSGHNRRDMSTGLEIYDTSTGECLASVTASRGMLKSLSLLVDSGP